MKHGRSSRARALSRGLFWGGLISLSCCVHLCQAATLLEQAIKAYNAGNYTEAIGRFGQAESTEFNNPILHYYLANALAKTNQTPDAIKEYRVALALEPTGQMAQYCKQALQALGAVSLEDPPKRKRSAASFNPDPFLDPLIGRNVSSGQQRLPQVMAVFCGCPLCQRLQLILTDLQSRYGDRINFVRSQQNAPDPAIDRLFSKLDVHSCPEIVFVDSNGTVTNRLQGVIAEKDLYRNTEVLLIGGAGPVPSSPPLGSDQRNREMAAAIAQEAEARISQNQKRLESDILRIQEDVRLRTQDLMYTSRRNSNYESISSLSRDSQKRIEQLRAEFQRSRDEIRAAAKSRVEALGCDPGNSSSYPTADPSNAPLPLHQRK